MSQAVASWSDGVALVDIVTSSAVAVEVDEAVGASAHVATDGVCTGSVFIAIGLASETLVYVRAGEAVASVALFALAFAHVGVVHAFAHGTAFCSCFGLGFTL